MIDFFRRIFRFFKWRRISAGMWLGWAMLLGYQAKAQVVGPNPADTLGSLHCLLLPLGPAQRVAHSALIVEAEVLDTQSEWDAGHRHLFTRHRLRVFSVLKGKVADITALSIWTEGGRLGLQQQILTNTLRLEPGQQGVFFLFSAPWAGLPADGPHWTPYGSEQGFIEYHPADGSASEPYHIYLAIDADFYQTITRLTGQPRWLIQPNPALITRPAQARTAQVLTITNLSPTELAAGVGDVLTITGSGFESQRGIGTIAFKNADDGGASWTTARTDDYLSWTDSQIQVRVPSTGGGGHPAGSGLVQVTTNGQLSALSITAIRVVYALTNVQSTTGTILQRPNHVAQNASGGISFHFAPNFGSNTAATEAWQRALANWRCHSGMNWEVSSAAITNTIADDGQNVVAFDQGSTAISQTNTALPTNILGRTTSYYLGCYAPTGEVIFWVHEIDMQFSSAANFQFGPATAVAPQIDFETVAVHELGHAQQLSHLILQGAIMHYAVARGQNSRALTLASDITGGRRVLRERSFRNQGCGGAALLPAPLTGITTSYVAGTGPHLNWTTHDECFLTGFTVERGSGLDTTMWQIVATVAVGLNTYQVSDTASSARLNYYRLGLLRPDGSTDYTTPQAVSGETTAILLFPNPVTGNELRLQYPASASSIIQFGIYDEVGRLHQSNVATVQLGLNVLSFDLETLPPGFYLLSYEDAAGIRRSRKFVRL